MWVWMWDLGGVDRPPRIKRANIPRAATPTHPPTHTHIYIQVAAAASSGGATGDAALTPQEARAVLVARVVSLVQGRAGVRREVVAALAAALNAGGYVGVVGGAWMGVLGWFCWFG